MTLGRGVRDWLDDRTGVARSSRRFLQESIPSSTGWRNTLGSVAGALLLLQLISGFLLTLYYVPHPDAVYASIAFVEKNITAGALVRALHYWGASFVVVVVFLHLTRVFFAGVYRPPRELTWIAGLGLLAVVVALAFTGQLLPWNQMGYWAANVGIEILSSVPIAGTAAKRLLIGHDTLGALTLARFHALHVVLLPALLGLLTAAHLYLLRRHGPIRSPGDRTQDTIPFAPRQFTRDLIAMTGVVAALIVVSAVAGGPISDPADPTDTTYVPHPEWYFQAPYQVLRLMPGSLKIVATVLLPGAIVLLALALPWLDRGPTARLSDRRAIAGGGGVVLASVVALTVAGVYSSRGAERPAASPEGSTYDMVSAGAAIAVREECRDCHVIGLEGGAEGPDLSAVGLRLQEPYLRRFLRDPKAFYPEIEMPAPDVTDRELTELIAYLMSLRDQ